MAMPGRVINPGLQHRSMSEKFMSEKVISVYENDSLRSATVNAVEKHVLVLTTTAAILTCGAIAASAQAPGTQPTPGGPMMQQQNQDDYHHYHGGMMGGGMMGHGMMGQGCGRGIMGPMAMRIIFSLMDANGEGKLSSEEFQAAHERIFRAMDTDHDGTVTLEEMQAFMRGH
jgi:predicted lipid-binding transport protein (Tim44 family)